MCRRGYKAWEDSRADSVEYLALYDKHFIGWTAEVSSQQGAKPACGLGSF